MIRSMTGFGRGKTQTEDTVVRAEVRSVNNRTLRISCRVPERLQGIEPELEKSLRHRIARGSVVLSLALDDLSGNSGPVLDKQVIAHYRDQLLELRDSLGLAGEVTIDNLIICLPGAGLTAGVGFPAAQTDAVDLVANGKNLLIPDTHLRGQIIGLISADLTASLDNSKPLEFR